MPVAWKPPVDYGFENVTLQKGTGPILILNIIDHNVNVNVKFNVKFVQKCKALKQASLAEVRRWHRGTTW
jgi:hypothetical protein